MHFIIAYLIFIKKEEKHITYKSFVNVAYVFVPLHIGLFWINFFLRPARNFSCEGTINFLYMQELHKKI